jgi:1-acyl-sn-glycerol-3-phosphate acyltransferase
MNDKIMYRLMRFGAHALARGRLQIEVSGLEHVPQQGPAILVARHYHHLFDGVALHCAIPRRVHILVTLDWAIHPLTRRFMEGLIRAARWPLTLRAEALAHRAPSGGPRALFTLAHLRRYQRRAIHDSIALLSEGRLLVIFPEGYPNVDPHYTPKTNADEMLPFKRGFVTIAAATERRLRTMIPLIPVGLRYTTGTKLVAHLNLGPPQTAGDFRSRDSAVRSFERQIAVLSNLAQTGTGGSRSTKSKAPLKTWAGGR